MVRVGVLTSVHPAFDTRIFYRECKSLVQAGYNVTLIVPHDRDEVIDGVSIKAVPRPKGRLYRMTRTVWQVYRQAVKLKADVYHFHDPELIPVGILLKLLHGSRVIHDIHEYYSEWIPVRNRLRASYGVTRMILHLLLERLPAFLFDLLIFPTASLQKECAPTSKSLALLNLPTLRDFVKNPDPADWERRPFDVLFVGAVSPARMKFMLQVAREVSKEVSRFKWLFVGIPEDAIQWTLENCSSVFLERHITMIPRWVPYSTVLDYAAKSRIGFNYHPRQRHLLVAIPMKVFEYMLCGLPLVTTALPELTNLMTHEKHGLLIDSDRPVDYANAIVSLLSNPEKGQSLGMAGQELVQSHLNWEKSEAWKLLSAYEGLLGNS